MRSTLSLSARFTHARLDSPIDRSHAAGADSSARRGAGADHRRQGRVDESRRQHQGSCRPCHDRGGRETRLAAARRHHHRSDGRQHRRRPRHGRGRARLPLHLRPARQDVVRKDLAAEGLRSRGRHHADGRRSRFAGKLQRRRRSALSRDSRSVAAQPVHQSRQSRDALPDHGARDLERHGRKDHRPRRRRRHRRHALRRRQVSEGTQLRHQGHRRRSGRLRPLRRHAPALEGRGDRRGLRAEDVQQPARRRLGAGQRFGIVPRGPRTGAARGHPRRRLQRHGDGRGSSLRAAGSRRRTSSSSCVRTRAATI